MLEQAFWRSRAAGRAPRPGAALPRRRARTRGPHIRTAAAAWLPLRRGTVYSTVYAFYTSRVDSRQVNVRMAARLHDELIKLSREHDVSVGFLIREAVEQHHHLGASEQGRVDRLEADMRELGGLVDDVQMTVEGLDRRLSRIEALAEGRA